MRAYVVMMVMIVLVGCRAGCSVIVAVWCDCGGRVWYQ